MSTTSSSSEKNQISLRRALRILVQLGNTASGLSFGEIRKGLDHVSPPGLSRILKVLVEEGWTEKTPEGSYIPGSAMRLLWASYEEQRSMADRMAVWVDRMAVLTGESASYVEYRPGGFIHCYKREMPESMHYMDINVLNSKLHINGLGKLCLAFQDDQVIDDEIRRLSLGGRETLRKELAEIPSRRVYVSKETSKTRLGFPVFHPERSFQGAVGITVIHQQQKRIEDLKGLLMDLRNELEEALEQ